MLQNATVVSNSTSTMNAVVEKYIAGLKAPITTVPDGRIVNCISDPNNALCVPTQTAQTASTSSPSAPTSKAPSRNLFPTIAAAAIALALAACLC